MASLKEIKTAACEAIDVHAKELHALSNDIWSHPELCFEEIFAHKTLTTFLEKHEYQVERHYVLDTAFRGTAEVGSGNGPHIAVICEYDALPDIGHACGHNVIAEVGAGAAVGLMAAIKLKNKQLNGKVTVLGTPAEEGGGGKVDLLDNGCFKGVDVAMMTHPCPIAIVDPPGVLSRQTCSVTYHGKASHAAGFPWEGINALDAAVMAYNNISCLRQQMKPTWRVQGIITNGGAKPNIIPEVAALEYSIRTPTEPEMRILKEKVINCFQAAAQATGCTMEIKWQPKPYKNMLNNQTLASLFRTNAKSLGVETDGDPKKMANLAFSTDMGNVSHIVPSIHPLFRIGKHVMNHTREFTAAIGDAKVQPYVIQQAKAVAMTALDILAQPELLARVKQDFQDDIKTQ